MTLKVITPKVGVFSAVIAVSIGALAFKGVDIAQAAFAVPPQFLAGQPTEPLDEGALHLADVQGRVHGRAAVVPA